MILREKFKKLTVIIIFLFSDFNITEMKIVTSITISFDSIITKQISNNTLLQFMLC